MYLALIFLVLISKILGFSKNEHFLRLLGDENDVLIPKKLTDGIINVKCFWIKGWNVFDISSLQTSE